jgi:hypothetical protein
LNQACCVLGKCVSLLIQLLYLLVDMFWVVLISYFGSLEISVESMEGDELVNLGRNIVDLASIFSKKDHMEVFMHIFPMYSIINTMGHGDTLRIHLQPFTF